MMKNPEKIETSQSWSPSEGKNQEAKQPKVAQDVEKTGRTNKDKAIGCHEQKITANC